MTALPMASRRSGAAAAAGLRAAAVGSTASVPSASAESSAAAPISRAALLASGCGTAIAAVCASGIVVITQQAQGLWAALAIACGGAIAFALARCFAQLAEHIPSSAGLLAYLGRGLGRDAALIVALPYLLLSLFLVGAEASIVGLLLSRILPVPSLCCAIGFVIGTWLLCRRGVQLSLRLQALCTWALLLGLGACALTALAQGLLGGQLIARLSAPAPTLDGFATAVAQSLFLFMGVELVTSQTSPVPTRTLRFALQGSALVLTAFYALLALGLACSDLPSLSSQSTLPQLHLAQQAAGGPAVLLITLLSLLASYTSFNGALLALSRLMAALAGMGSVPRRFAQLDGRSLLPQTALTALLLFCIAATLLIHAGGLLWAAIVAAAPTAAVVYAATAWARERLPAGRVPTAGAAYPPSMIHPPWHRPLWRRLLGRGLAVLLLGLAVAVLGSVFHPSPAPAPSSSGPPASALHVGAIVAAAYALSFALVLRARSQARPYRRTHE